MDKQPNCKQRWAKQKNGRMVDLRHLLAAWYDGESTRYAKKVTENLGKLREYGLCFDYVGPNTFVGYATAINWEGKRKDITDGQVRGYWRYQLSWGGPSDEIRFYTLGNSPKNRLDYVTYTFMDWFDGYERKLVGRDLELMDNLWDYFKDYGVVLLEYNKAMASVEY